MNMCDAFISGKRYSVISPEEYANKWRMYDEHPEMYSHTAMELAGDDGRNYILPFRGRTDDRPGIVSEGAMYLMRFPKTDEDKDTYDKSKSEVVDFSDVNNVQQYIDKTEKVRAIEGAMLTDIDDLFKPVVGPNDTPQMRIFKEAVSEKNCDIGKYADRFGPNFLNDKRIFKASDITLKKMVEMCEHLDIKIEMRLSDANSDVPNPMNKEFQAVLTFGEEEVKSNE